MEFIAELIKGVDPLPMGISIALIGTIFWYIPNSRYYRVVERVNLSYAENLRINGHVEGAQKVEAMYVNARRRLPVYGILFIIMGCALIGWGALSSQ